ncbi:hypothetical protein WRSd3_02170 [Shigella dysenteriae WRSd3]|uniref:Uncharacterized protein n=2 Tax=Shigella dysenteriae TaxID=622 RepID=A0A090NGR5_SHIDY|nr:hypothetical protein Asd1617_01259 [Shigella dysenteriae 1617]ESU79407.1 hypothetical protein WRSd3_02170 [Shigella dysenteriae WRSd3]ESU82932.1 hypothetical protein WRSd5_02259 [Shigella dysenteriae WRSd5]
MKQLKSNICTGAHTALADCNFHEIARVVMLLRLREGDGETGNIEGERFRKLQIICTYHRLELMSM